MAVHFHRVRDHDGVVIDAQDAFRDAGLAVSGAAVEEQRLVADQGGAELVEQAVGQDEVVEGLAQALAAQADVGGLRLDYLLVLLDGDRGGSDVLADFVACGGHGAAAGGQGERIVVARHAFDFQQLLLAELMEEGFENGEGELEGLVQARQSAGTVQPQVAENEIGDDRAGYTQVLDAIRYDGPAILPEGGRGYRRGDHPLRNIHGLRQG